MRKILISSLIILSFKAKATNYYVDNSGSDANAGTSAGTAWQTVSKVNSSMGSFVSGDSILFNGNGTWNEHLTITKAGINIGRYGTGNKPLFTGFTTISLSNIGGNIWQGTASLKGLNTVLYNGVIVAKGRYPNTGYLTFTSHTVADTSITGSLPDAPSYVGGEVVVRTNHFILDNRRINYQTSGKISFTKALTYDPVDGYGYFIQNISSVLDVNGEWSCDSTVGSNNFNIYSTTTPTVQVSNIDTLISVNARNVSITNIQFSGANKAAIQLYNGSHSTLTYNYIINSGRDGIAVSNSDTVIIKYDSTINSWNDGMMLRYNPDSPAINNYYMIAQKNYVYNSGMAAGMGGSGNYTYSGIEIVGNYHHCDSNTIRLVGYDGIVPTGDTSTVNYNVVDSFCSVKNDGGAIYTVTQKHGLKIDSNIVTNSLGANAIAGTTGWAFLTVGIYIDNACSNVTTIGNTCYNIHGGYGIGLFINGGSNEIIKYNTLMDTDSGSLSIAQSTGSGNIILSNKFVQTNTTSVGFEKANSFQTFASFDSDFYSRPLREDSITLVVGASYFFRSLANFKIAASPYEANAFGTPANTVGVPVIYYNSTSSNSTVSLPNKMKDYLGTVYSGSVTLTPYTSIVLYNYNYKIYFGYHL